MSLVVMPETFAETVVGWYHANRRDLPWRREEFTAGFLHSTAGGGEFSTDLRAGTHGRSRRGMLEP